MHIYFSYIGGGGIGPLAMIAKQAGYDVSGSDKKDSSPYIELAKKSGISDIGIGVGDEFIRQMHAKKPIDWFVHSSAVEKEFPDHPEFVFCRKNNIKMTKRDEFLSHFISDHKLKLIAIAGTHGKTTTTAMAVWLFKQLGMPISYSVGAKISFGDMGEFDPQSQYFVYECDEFDRNFLAFYPYIALITGLAWDHHEIYKTREEYNEAFKQFLSQSERQVLWQSDAELLGLEPNERRNILDERNPDIGSIKLAGLYNRRDAYLVAQAVQMFSRKPITELLNKLSIFPGVSRRFEKISGNLYTDYAHTPEKIVGAMGVAQESASPGQKIVIVYEPLTNRRMHYTKDLHRDIFSGASAIYWVPSYLAREDSSQEVLEPAELIKSLSPDLQKIAQPMRLDHQLKSAISGHLASGDLVLCLSGGGGGSLDEWLRENFSATNRGPSR